jgi:serine phosphatase RsbU (regulator of sigma subunit)
LNLLLLSSITAFILNLFLAALVYFKRKKQLLNIIFALFLLANAIAIIGDFFQFIPISDKLAPILWMRIAYTGAIFTPPFFIHFIFLLSKTKISKVIISLFYLLSALFLLLNWFSTSFFLSIMREGQNIAAVTGIYYDLLMSYVGIALIFSLIFGLWKYFVTSGEIKERLKYHLYGVLALIFALVFYYPSVKIGIKIRIDNLCQVLYCALLAYAITKKGVLDIRIVISRFSAQVLSLGIVIASFLFISSIIKVSNVIHIWGLLLITIFWALFYIKFRQIVLTPLEKKFLRGYYDINQILTNISSDLLLIQNRKKAMKLILKIFRDELETKGNYFILANCKENKFYLYKDNLNNVLEEVSSKHSLINYFYLGNKFVLLKDLPNIVQEDISEFPFYPKSLFYSVKSFDKMHGLFIFGEKLSGEKYSNNDLKMIEAITNQLTVVLDRLFYQDQLKEKNQELNKLNDSLENQVQEQVKEIDEKRKLERDLKLAKEIQERILPDRVPKLTNFKFETAFHPAKEVSGDYYDFLVFSEDLVVIVLADIVGKGVAASMLMIYLKNTVHQHIRAKDSPAEGLEKLNRIIMESSVFKTHLPLIYAKLDIKNQIITYANAGSDAGLYFHKGKVKELETGGIPLGMDYDASFEEETLQLSDRDIVLFYTDGLTDARNEKGDNFGLEQVKKMVKEYIKKKDPSKLLVPHIKEVWLKYTDEENRQKDDMTLVSIEMEKLQLFDNNN